MNPLHQYDHSEDEAAIREYYRSLQVADPAQRETILNQWENAPLPLSVATPRSSRARIAAVVAALLVLVTVSAGLQSYDMNQEMVARSLGASRLTAFLTVTLPQIKFSVISAALLAFIVAFDEVVISVFISGGENSTLTRVMFSSLRDEVDPTIAAVSTILLVLATVPPVILQFVTEYRKARRVP